MRALLASVSVSLSVTASVFAFACVAAGCGSSTGGTGSNTVPTPDSGTASDTGSGTDDADYDSGPDYFADAGDYTPGTAHRSLVSRHVVATGKTLDGTDCLKCHDGSSDDAPLLSFGGTVYWDDGKTGAPNVEVVVVDKNGTPTTVYSDVDGNFWQLGDPTTYGWPAHTAARDATDSVGMISDFSQGGCNAAKCHDGTTDAPRITLPTPPDVSDAGADAPDATDAATGG